VSFHEGSTRAEDMNFLVRKGQLYYEGVWAVSKKHPGGRDCKDSIESVREIGHGKKKAVKNIRAEKVQGWRRNQDRKKSSAVGAEAGGVALQIWDD